MVSDQAARLELGGPLRLFRAGVVLRHGPASASGWNQAQRSDARPAGGRSASKAAACPRRAWSGTNPRSARPRISSRNLARVKPHAQTVSRVGNPIAKLIVEPSEAGKFHPIEM